MLGIHRPVCGGNKWKNMYIINKEAKIKHYKTYCGLMGSLNYIQGPI